MMMILNAKLAVLNDILFVAYVRKRVAALFNASSIAVRRKMVLNAEKERQNEKKEYGGRGVQKLG